MKLTKLLAEKYGFEFYNIPKNHPDFYHAHKEVPYYAIWLTKKRVQMLIDKIEKSKNECSATNKTTLMTAKKHLESIKETLQHA